MCRDYAINNREKRNKRLRDYRKKHPEKAKDYDLRGRLKKEYGITPEQRDEMFKLQNNTLNQTKVELKYRRTKL